ncbi:MAG: hypothetical protein HY867_11440 [Chloroflexi bacterium]|nr:hypothetical protein [Chloroflexota bacterium]
MKANLILLIVLVALSHMVTACGPGQLFGPTITPSPTNTPTPSPTLTPTITPSPTATLTPTITPSPTPSCAVKNGKWESNEVGAGHATGPIFTFTVENCQITQAAFWANLAPGAMFWLPIKTDVTIQDKSFSHTNTDPLGGFTVEGTFDSETYSQGIIFFPKGYNALMYVLPEDLIINWTAHPIQ